MKKIFLVFFIFVILSNPANATPFKDVVANATYTEEINTLSELGIMQGESQNFRPNDTITRSEFVAVLCRALKISIHQMETAPSFSDVKANSWALPYIEAAVKNGIVKGFKDGNFHPNEPVTNEQVIKMIISGWGYSEEAEKLGGYPNGYFEIAKRHEIFSEVLFNYKNPAKRFVAAMFTYKALSMPFANKELMQESTLPLNASEGNNNENNTKPIPEQVAIDDPIQMLRKVTLESARFERTVFEQPWEPRKAPFFFKNKSFIYKFDTANINANISVFGDGKTVFLSKNMIDKSVNFSLPAGRWRFVFYTEQNHIKDEYFSYVKVDSNGNTRMENEIWRYTYLKIQPGITEETRNIDSFTDTYLKATAEKSNDGNITFTFVADNLNKGRRLTICIGNEVNQIFGKDDKVSVSFTLPAQEIYIFQSTIVDDDGQETIKGDIKFDSKTDVVLFTGAFHKVINKGFVFVD